MCHVCIHSLIPPSLSLSRHRSDVDVLVVQNPFDHLKRDSDVEGMSDGFDDLTAYGGTYGVRGAVEVWV